MISNRDLAEKTKPILKDSYFQVFICIAQKLIENETNTFWW